jgi:hypothetical protein
MKKRDEIENLQVDEQENSSILKNIQSPRLSKSLTYGAERDGVDRKSSRRESSPEHTQQKAAMVSRKRDYRRL